jgi:integrase
MASIEKRISQSGLKSYRVKVRLKGSPAQSATFQKLSDAKRWVTQTEAAIRDGRYFKTLEAQKHSVAELLDRYINSVLVESSKKKNEKTQQLNWWKMKLGAYSLADISPSLIVQCRDELSSGLTNRGTRRSPATVVQYMSALSHAFTIAVNEWGWLEDSPLRKVKKPSLPRGRVRFLTDTERQRLLIACQASSNKQLYLCVIVALSTGMRQAELMQLSWQDLNLDEGFIILQHTKNGERRRVPLAGHGLDLLREYSNNKRLDTNLLFPSNKNSQQVISLRQAFNNALKTAEITNFRWHDLRHCTASYLAMNGASLAEIAEVLGHKTLTMVKRYAHLSDGHVSNIVASMNEKIFGEK